MEQSASAALATVAQFHGLPIRPGEVAAVVGLPAVTDLGELVVASRLLGFDSVPLEGGYDELPEVARPNVVLLRDGRFVVLYEIDADRVTVGDPLEGLRDIARDDFCARWTGDCLQLVPLAAGLNEARAKIAARRNVIRRLVSPRPLFMGLGAVGIAVLVALARFSSVAAALGVAAASSLWLVLSGPACPSCHRAHALAGALPLDRLGVIFYASLLVVVRFDARLAGYPLFAAAGMHLALVALLARARTACWPCLVTAASALTACGIVAFGGGLSLAVGTLLVVGGAAIAAAAIPFSRRTAEQAALWRSRRVAREWLRNAGDVQAGKVRVVVWKRAGCAACLFYEAVFKPALQQEFEDAVVIEERDASKLGVPTPLILVAGRLDFLFIGLSGNDDDYAKLQQAVEGARDPALASLKPLGGLLVVEP